MSHQIWEKLWSGVGSLAKRKMLIRKVFGWVFLFALKTTSMRKFLFNNDYKLYRTFFCKKRYYTQVLLNPPLTPTLVAFTGVTTAHVRQQHAGGIQHDVSWLQTESDRPGALCPTSLRGRGGSNRVPKYIGRLLLLWFQRCSALAIINAVNCICVHAS